MTTIAVSDETKRELLKFVSELQVKLGRRVDFDEAIRFLLAQRKGRNPALLEEACVKIEDAESLIDELHRERELDEEEAFRRLSS